MTFAPKSRTGQIWGDFPVASLAIILVLILGLILPDMLLATSPGGGGGGGGGGGVSRGTYRPQTLDPVESESGPASGTSYEGLMGWRPSLVAPQGGGDIERAQKELEKASKKDSDAGKQDRGQTSGTSRTVAQPVKSVDVVPPRKLVAPRAPYITELAIDIQKTLMDLAANDPAGAVKLYKGALAQAQRKVDTQAEREARRNLGHVYFLTGQFRLATENYEKVLEILRKLQDTGQEAVALRDLAAVLTASGNYDEAEEASQEALKKLSQAGMATGLQMALNNAAILEKNRGRFAKAEETYNRALAAEKEASGRSLRTLNNLGSLLRTTGQYKQAAETYEQAIQTARKIGDSRAEGDILIRIADVFSDWGQNDKALERAQNALEVLTKAGAPTDRAHKIIADLYMDSEQADRAEKHAKQADYDSSLGRFYLLQGQLDDAKKRYEQLLNTAKKQDNLDELFTAYVGLGKVFEAMNKFREAEKNYSSAMDITEEIRSNLLLSERKNFLASKVNGFARSEPAKGLVRVALKQGKGSQSIYPSEATKARDFADNLAQKAEGSYFEVSEDLLKKEREVNDRLASAKMGRSVASKELDQERFADLSNQIKKAESERNSFIETLRQRHKDYASVKYPKPVKLEEAAIGPQEYTLLLDILGESVGVRVLKGKQVVKAYLTGWNAAELEDEIRKFREPFEQRPPRLSDFDVKRASAIYDNLLAEALKMVPEGKSITIVPDGMLALLPFEALVTGGKADWKKGRQGHYYPQGVSYLADRNPLVYYQSLTALTLARTLGKKKTSGERVLIMADPVFQLADARLQGAKPEIKKVDKENDRFGRLMAAMEEDTRGCLPPPSRLPETENLAKNLVNLYGPKCDAYTGLDSTKATFLNKVAPGSSQYQSIVFATHGYAGNKIPGIMEPVLFLTMVPPGTDGLLTMSEVAGLKLNADIACLTACQTGVGVKLAGEGIMSMGRAFQCAGTKSVVMSLWSVAEDSSVMFMDEFFKSLKDGKGRLEAFTTARNRLLEAGFENPFFWAAFVLVGEGA